MKIMIIGGYGQVGSIVAKNLFVSGEQIQVVIAGRHLEKAMQLKNTLSSLRVEARKIDVTQDITSDLTDIDTVVMCLEQNNASVLEACIKAKVNYVDITPSTQIMKELVKKKTECKKAGITVVLGVGIAPGQSNLLAVQAASKLDQVERIDSYLMLGVGEQHGRNAISWLIDNLNKQYITDGEYGNQTVMSFHEIKKQKLVNGKTHAFTRIDLADSMINRAIYPGAKCNSWFAYDVNYYTKMVSFMQRCGMFALLRYPRMHPVYHKVFTISMKISKMLRIGTDRYEILVNATGIKNGERTMITKHFTGNCNNEITAKVTADAVLGMPDYHSGIVYYAQEISKR